MGAHEINTPRGPRPPFSVGGPVLVSSRAGALVPGLAEAVGRFAEAVVVDAADGTSDPFPFVVLDGDAGTLLATADASRIPDRARHFAVALLDRVVRMGHVVTTGRVVVVSTEFGRAAGGLPHLADLLGVRPGDVVAMPSMPGHAQGGVDSFALPLDPETVVVPELDDRAFDTVRLPHEVALGRLVQTFLDVRAAEFGAFGVRVERLPMMPPIHLVQDRTRKEAWSGAVVSPTQSLMVVSRRGRACFLPRFFSDEFPIGYRGVVASHVAAWTSLFSEWGYDVVPVDVELLAKEGRALTQLALQIPER